MPFYRAMTKYWTIQKMALTGDRETCGSVGVNPQKGVCLPFGGPFLPFSSFIIASQLASYIFPFGGVAIKSSLFTSSSRHLPNIW